MLVHIFGRHFFGGGEKVGAREMSEQLKSASCTDKMTGLGLQHPRNARGVVYHLFTETRNPFPSRPCHSLARRAVPGALDLIGRLCLKEQGGRTIEAGS